jgi:DNA (cytosine-5)-methyltransferase 1
MSWLFSQALVAAYSLGWRTVCAVERDAYAAAVLAQRQNDGCLEPFPVWSDVETFDGRPWRGIVDIVSGGFPCTDISCAGKGAGIEGEESGLWREMWRIIGEVQPRFVLVENSPMLTIRGGVRVVGDLAALGYDARWGVVSAADAIWFECLSRDGVPALDHLRERMWIVAEDADREGNGGRAGLREDGQEQDGNQPTDGRGDDPAGADSIGKQFRFNATKSEGRREADRGAGENTDATGTDAALGRLAVRWWPSRNAGYHGRVHEVADGLRERGCGGDSERQDAEDARQLPGSQTLGPGWWAVER